MIFGKLWHSFMAQVNKIANFFWTSDPIAQLQYEYDMAVEQLKSGREGLEQYQALVQRLNMQVNQNQRKVNEIQAKAKAYLTAGDRETAGRYALELNRAKAELEENSAQLKLHEDSYNNNVEKIRHSTKKIADLQNKIHQYDAELKMSKAEAEMAKLAQDFNFNVTTDFGQIEKVIQDKISLNRAKAKVAADLSSEGIADIKAEKEMEKNLGEQALSELEIELGLKTPEIARPSTEIKDLGPVEKTPNLEKIP